MALVQIADLSELSQKIDLLARMLEVEGVDRTGTREYVEPGPGSPRQYFSPGELSERWDWSESKVYALRNSDLPRFKHGQLVRYHWAHVWAFEGKITWETAQSIFEADAVQEGSTLPNSIPQSTGVRRIS